MTTNRTTHINTIEELVSWITGHKYSADTKWKMFDRDDMVWVDEEEGKAWNDLYDSELKGLEWSSDEWRAKRDVVLEMQPPKVSVTRYELNECGSTYHGKCIYLSEELGRRIDAVWTHKPASWNPNRLERTGNLTIPGMLKRLGTTDIGDRIAAARKAEKLAEEKNSRNYDRRELRNMAEQAKRHLADLGLTTAATLDDLLALVEEE